ncbi:integrase [Acidithiobacillus ferridurans]|uniref:tyrosine-type recombinase/integrase n=1 Tax=Acidithiobacillus ferridurans TaxID=1232575 RepID=UPI000DE545C1|nr:site-specific integrase [Acidithiobacillus ferridurans]RBM03682.1 integrase [Acidithiobacillus ferridurans]
MLTDRKIQTLKPKEARYEIADENDHGRGTLILRVSPSGKKAFVLRYSIDRNVHRLTLGEYGTRPDQLTLAAARTKANEIGERIDAGLDPIAQERERQVAYAKEPTVSVLALEYIEKWAKLRKRSWAEDQRILEKDILPHWGTRKAESITRKEVVALLDRIAARGAPIAANRTLAVLRKMYNFAISRSIVDQSPCLGVQSPSKEHQKDRVLNDDEIVVFWKGLETAAMSLTSKLALRFMLVTGQRLGEVCRLTQEQMDGDWWIIPAEIAKNGRAHRVPLSPLAISIIDEAQSMGIEHYLFPSSRVTEEGKDRVMSPTALSHALRKNLSGMKITSFTPHDLRRTAATHIGMLGHNRLVISKILNHVEGGVTAIYDRHTYDSEKRAALEDWSLKIEKLVANI